ncbi:DUF2259 domain-containing protein (plasmid) [Rhizobium sp. RCAM05350]|nr:DUF2259 domain-containing protein [Rhizobium sp. RCAM05350]
MAARTDPSIDTKAFPHAEYPVSSENLRHRCPFCAAFVLYRPCRRGDAAARHIFGFSLDGDYFAFEQYGVLDWSDSDSGWSEITILDTRTGKIVGDKAIRVADEIGDRSLTLEDARRQVRMRADPLLAKYAIATPGDRIAIDTTTRPDEMVPYVGVAPLEEASPKSLVTDGRLKGSAFHLDQTLAAGSEDCAASLNGALPGDKTGKALGFRLVLNRPAGQPERLHEDALVPAWRNCPTSYSLSEAYLLTPEGGQPVVAVLVQWFSQGYEGRDRRFLAVTAAIGLQR